MNRLRPRAGEQARGATLVELFVVLCLVAVVSSVVTKLMRSVGRAQKGFSQQVMLQMDSRKAFDTVVDQVREGTDVIRPLTGETLDFLVFKDIVNKTTVLYLEPNNALSEKLNQKVYKLVSYRTDYSGAYQSSLEKTLMDCVKRIRFSSLSPNSVQVTATVINDKGEYQFLAHIGLMNLGGLE